MALQQLLMCLSGRTKGHLALTRLTVKRQEKPLYLYFSFGTFCKFIAYVQSCTFVFFTQGHSIWKRLNMHVIHILHLKDASLSTPFSVSLYFVSHSLKPNKFITRAYLPLFCFAAWAVSVYNKAPWMGLTELSISLSIWHRLHYQLTNHSQLSSASEVYCKACAV